MLKIIFLLKTLVLQHLSRRDLWLLSFLASIILLSITLLLTHSTLLRETAEIDTIIELISSPQPEQHLTPPEILKTHLVYSGLTVIHLLGVIIILLLAIGNPLDDRNYLLPIACCPISRPALLTIEIFSTLGAFIIFMAGPFSISLINTCLAGGILTRFAAAAGLLSLKFIFLLAIFYALREVSSAILAGVFTPVLYFIAHLQETFTTLARQLQPPWNWGARILQIISPPLHRFGFYGITRYRQTPVLIPLDLLIIICFILILTTIAYLRHFHRDLI